jgi:hypothetical protein
MTDDRETGQVWYFAYGSNLDPDRFRDRVGEWQDLRAVTLPGWRLRFSGDVESEGGGGAVLEEREGSTAYGAAYLVDSGQMEAMDQVEIHSERNQQGKGYRRSVALRWEEGTMEAEVYLVRDNETWRAPSETYLGHILKGLKAVGHPEEVLRAVRETAAAEPGA